MAKAMPPHAPAGRGELYPTSNGSRASSESEVSPHMRISTFRNHGRIGKIPKNRTGPRRVTRVKEGGDGDAVQQGSRKAYFSPKMLPSPDFLHVSIGVDSHNGVHLVLDAVRTEWDSARVADV